MEHRQSSQTDVFSHAQVTLYEGLSVRPSVGRSVRRSVRPSPVFFIAEFKPKSDLTSINAPAQRLRLIWSYMVVYLALFLTHFSLLFKFPDDMSDSQLPAH